MITKKEIIKNGVNIINCPYADKDMINFSLKHKYFDIVDCKKKEHLYGFSCELYPDCEYKQKMRNGV